ncbi:ATP-dependent sacrificial sulfur transferase LarE [Sedimentisphaera salicampi]|uniref:GMP synthase n=1 Tax=Sedimentisphaera salicampi TaxID=1941349 RepID=A0A1W6LMJ5_9BACT|nr:ATP-dependent sacrificial sulfur transferase LarE [Sedimentisphaera salicampi]ARN56972.1 GMP synthase [Sedimentisphaera salicampi]
MCLKKYEKLCETIRRSGKVCVSFSGGVDSSFLAYTCRKVLGKKNMLCVYVRGAAASEKQTSNVSATAEKYDFPLEIINVNELEVEQVRRGDPRRCYFCKKNIISLISRKAEEKGFNIIACGSNLDDLSDYRPGRDAVKEMGVSEPLLEAKLTKDEIRSLSRKFGLDTADMPSEPCLLSRIPYNRPADRRMLTQVEEAEKVLADFGFDVCRVRHYGITAKIEIPPEKFEQYKKSEQHIKEKILNAGFSEVVLDENGFRSGSLNDSLRFKHKQNHEKMKNS